MIFHILCKLGSFCIKNVAFFKRQREAKGLSMRKRGGCDGVVCCLGCLSLVPGSLYKYFITQTARL